MFLAAEECGQGGYDANEHSGFILEAVPHSQNFNTAWMSILKYEIEHLGTGVA